MGPLGALRGGSDGAIAVVSRPVTGRPGPGLIAYYLNPDRLPVDRRWPRQHAHTQRRLCERFAAPVIGCASGS